MDAGGASGFKGCSGEKDWLRKAVLQVAGEEKQSCSTGQHRVATSMPRCCTCTNNLQLTLVWWNQQIQRLLGEIGPDCHHLFPQFCVHLMLINTT